MNDDEINENCSSNFIHVNCQYLNLKKIHLRSSIIYRSNDKYWSNCSPTDFEYYYRFQNIQPIYFNDEHWQTCNQLYHIMLSWWKSKFQKAALTCFATRLVNNNQVTINAFKYVTIISCYDRLPSVGTSPKSRRRGREVANCLMSVAKVLLKDYTKHWR